ncbi:hypothetical protein OQA88_1552 [Cercophora sp. LCS_1]
MRLSGLQKEILSLYRQCLRECRKKPESTRAHFQTFARHEFDKNINVDKRDFAAIEFLLRKGRRQLEMYASPGVKDKGSPHRRPKVKIASPLAPNAPPAGSPSLAHRAAEEVMHKPLSESLQKLRRAQRALVRRRRRSKIRVSFAHSTSSRGSKVAAGKRKSRDLKQSDIRSIPLAVPDTHNEIDLGNPAQLENDRGPYPLFDRETASSSRDNGCCPSNPSRRPRVPPKTGLERDAQQVGVKAVAATRPYWGTLQKSPHQSSPKPETLRELQSAIPAHTHTGNHEEKSQMKNSSHVGQTSAPKRPLPPVPGPPRYTLFPKATYQKKASHTATQPSPVNATQSESVRRSLSQQNRLSALVPSDPPATSAKVAQAEAQRLILTAGPTSDALALRCAANLMSRSSSQQITLDSFARELEEFAIVTGAVRKHTVSTPSAPENHASIHTVQELLPYHQQFQEAGLAVTSTDQRVPLKKEKSLGSHGRRSQDERLRLDGRSSSAGATSSSSTQVSSSGTVIHLQTAVPVSLAPVHEVTKRPSEDQKTNRDNHGPEPRHRVVEPIPAVATPGYPTPDDRKVNKPRPSAVFLANKPLPAKPVLPQPGDVKQPRGIVKEAKKAIESRVDQKTPPRPRGERKLPQMSNESQTSTGSQSTAAPQATPGSSSKVDKALPALPTARISSQVRHGIALPSKTSWMPIARHLPTTIAEETEPSPQRQRTPPNKTIITKHDSMDIKAKYKNISQPDTDNTRLSVFCKPELPETWKNALGTPSSFEKALDDVVRKLDDMGESKLEYDKDGPGSRRASSKPPSPSQRLQRAAALRRQRLAEATVQGLDAKVRAVPAAVLIPARSSMRKEESGSRKSAKMPDVADTMPPHEDEEISDRDVLKGLKIICAASADTELDAWIRTKTGLRLRRFLADLKTFEGLSQDGIAAVDDQRAARRRRAEKRKVRVKRVSQTSRSSKQVA